jgi:hypothetical protein
VRPFKSIVCVGMAEPRKTWEGLGRTFWFVDARTKKELDRVCSCPRPRGPANVTPTRTRLLLPTSPTPHPTLPRPPSRGPSCSPRKWRTGPRIKSGATAVVGATTCPLRLPSPPHPGRWLRPRPPTGTNSRTARRRYRRPAASPSCNWPDSTAPPGRRRSGCSSAAAGRSRSAPVPRGPGTGSAVGRRERAGSEPRGSVSR